MTRAASTLVLDTNAWLDLLVFEDPALAGLADRITAGEIGVAIDDRALAEFERVLGYRALRLVPEAIAEHVAKVRVLSTPVDVRPQLLPACRDPDDQLFLEIAVAAGASALLTRDVDLLRMHRRMLRDHGVSILSPAAWRDGVGQMSKR